MLDPDRISAAVMASQQTAELGILTLCILLVGACLSACRRVAIPNHGRAETGCQALDGRGQRSSRVKRHPVSSIPLL